MAPILDTPLHDKCPLNDSHFSNSNLYPASSLLSTAQVTSTRDMTCHLPLSTGTTTLGAVQESQNDSFDISTSTSHQLMPKQAALMGHNEGNLMFSSWSWPDTLGSIPPSGLLDPPPDFRPIPLGPQASVSKKDLSLVDHDQPYQIDQFFQRSPPPSISLLSPLSFPPGLGSVLLHQDGFQSGCERPCDSEPGHPPEENEMLSPLYWRMRRKSILASPFSEDADSDDGLAPSPFSSPESTSGSAEDDEGPSHQLFFSPSSVEPHHQPRYHHIDEYPHSDLYHDHIDGDLPALTESSSSSPSSLSSPISLSESDSQDAGSMSLSSSYPFFMPGIAEDLQSPSLHPASLPIFDPFYYSDDVSLEIPGSPRYRSMDLPPLESESNPKSNGFGLGLHSTATSVNSSFTYPGFGINAEIPPPPGVSQRVTWLSLPGADTDDDLIPADLASKTYIPDPSITVPTTPPSRSLLIWDPTTRSGLPSGLPPLDGSSHAAHRFDIDALPVCRPHSPDEDFDVDPILLAKLTEIDAEKGVEVQKLCELKQRTTMAAAAAVAMAASRREGAQVEAERVKERCREVTALLRLKLMLDEKKSKSGITRDDVAEHGSNGGTTAGGHSPAVAPPFDPSSATLSSSLSAPTSTPEMLTDPSSNSSTSTPPTSTSPPIIRRRTSKPKITSMAQLVANMVFHRQQDALRRSPNRSRTWSPPSCVAAQTTTPTTLGKTRSRTQTSPTSPLRQMILPEDLERTKADDKQDAKRVFTESPLQLSPLCLSLCKSPESFYAQLEGPVSPSDKTTGDSDCGSAKKKGKKK